MDLTSITEKKDGEVHQMQSICFHTQNVQRHFVETSPRLDGLKEIKRLIDRNYDMIK